MSQAGDGSTNGGQSQPLNRYILQTEGASENKWTEVLIKSVELVSTSHSSCRSKQKYGLGKNKKCFYM